MPTVDEEHAGADLAALRARWQQMDVDGYERMTVERAAFLAALDGPLLEICQGRVLELACGTGRFLAALQARPGVTGAVGLDLVPQMLRAARGKGLGPLVQADAERLPFAGGSFDAVVCTFYSLRDMNRPRVYAEVARVLRPGGRFGFTLRSYYVTYVQTLWRQFVRRRRWPRSLRTLDGVDGVRDDVRDFRVEVDALAAAGLRLASVRTLRYLPLAGRWLGPGYWSGLRATRLGSDIIAIAER